MTREEWKALAGCSEKNPVIATCTNAATPYVYRVQGSIHTISESMILKLVKGGIIVGKIAQPGLRPDIHFNLTERGKIALEVADTKYEKTKRERGAG